MSSKRMTMADSPPLTAAERKQQRLAAALRANLRKRKERAREAGATSRAPADNES